MNVLTKFPRFIRNWLGYVPCMSRFIFHDPVAIYSAIKAGDLKYNIDSIPARDRHLYYYNVSISLRDDALMWHPKNPYTMKKLESIPPKERRGYPFHPENMAWTIMRNVVVEKKFRPSPTDNSEELAEKLIYSLTLSPPEDTASLAFILESTKLLVERERFDLLDGVFSEIDAMYHNMSHWKLGVLLHNVREHAGKLTPVHYLRVASKHVDMKSESNIA